MKKVEKFSIVENKTIKEAISVIQHNHSRCVIVVNKHKKVTGVFSEGDLLIAILRGVDLHTPLKRVLNPSFLYLNKKDILAAYKFVKKYGISLLPVIDKNFKLKDVVTIYDIMDHLVFLEKRSK